MWVSGLKPGEPDLLSRSVKLSVSSSVPNTVSTPSPLPEHIATHQAEKKIKSENKMVKRLQALGWSSTGSTEAKTQL